MLDYKKYEMEFPKKEEFTRIYGYAYGKLIWEKDAKDVTEEDRSKVNTTEKAFFKSSYNKKVKEHRKKEQDLRREFEKDLYEEYGVVTNPRKEKAFEYAWNEGHGYGFREVEGVFSDLVDIIE